MSQVNMEKLGGTRYNASKPGSWWAIPLYGLKAVARVTENGSDKYAPRDWREGQSFSTLLDSMSRHWLAVMEYGPWARNEDDGGVYHLAQLTWNALCLLTFMVLGRHDLDDVTPWYGVTTDEKRKAERVAEQQGISVEEVLRNGIDEAPDPDEPRQKLDKSPGVDPRKYPKLAATRDFLAQIEQASSGS